MEESIADIKRWSKAPPFIILGVGSLNRYDGSSRGGRNFNNILLTGIWFTNTWDGAWSNAPEQATCTTLVLNYSDTYIAQLFLGNNIFFRKKGESGWESWKKLNN